MRMARALAAAAIGYGSGLFPSADLVARGVDPRSAGSGNPGAANVAALLGRRAGGAVFGLDVAKALVAGRIGRAVLGPAGANLASSAAVFGHCFPVTKGFDGGKGVAASFGQMLATFPAYLPVDLALGAVAANSDYWKRRPVATISATCALWVLLAGVSWRRGLPNLWGPRPTGSMPAAAVTSSLAIISRFAEAERRARAEAAAEESSG